MRYINCGFHDTVIHGFQYRPSMKRDILILDIDYINGFDKNSGKGFYLIPSNLVFERITDLKIYLDWGDTGFSSGCLTNPMINQIEKREIKHAHQDPYYEWRFEFHNEGNILNFGSKGYILRHRSEPIWSENTYLNSEDRIDAYSIFNSEFGAS